MSENPFVSPIDALNEGLRPYSYWRIRASKVLRAWQNQFREAGSPTGLTALDNFIRLTPGELTILAARPGMGKTALALQIGGNMVLDPLGRERVAVFSAEMSGWSLYMRMACAAAGVSMFDLRSGRASTMQYDKVQEAIKSLAELPLLVDDMGNPSAEYMRGELAEMAKIYDLRGMIFDFVELMESNGNGEQAISNSIKALKQIAKDFDMPVIAISHLNREVESRRTRIPELSDLRYSGMIEQLADIVLLMVRPRYYVEKGMDIDQEAYRKMETDDGLAASNLPDIAYLFVGKNRNGRTGIARLGYDAPNMRFYDIRRQALEGDRRA